MSACSEREKGVLSLLPPRLPLLSLEKKKKKLHPPRHDAFRRGCDVRRLHAPLRELLRRFVFVPLFLRCHFRGERMEQRGLNQRSLSTSLHFSPISRTLMFLMRIVGSHSVSQQSAPGAGNFCRLHRRSQVLLGSASIAAVASAMSWNARESTQESRK